MSKKISILTLGCAKNTVDSEELLKQIENSGYKIVINPEKADVLVINTCGFVEDAKEESLDAIFEAVELKRKGRLEKIIVMGCLSERYKSELVKEIPEVDKFIGTNKIDSVAEELGIRYKNELLGERHLTTPKHYAYLKISEGCNNPCSFCAIPIMRGKYQSKPMERVILEAKRLALLGVKELIVIAQDTTYYGLDLYGKRRLHELLNKISDIEGIEWIRLMYTYPARFPLELLEVFDNDKICKYIDIPLQHISDKILKSMRRGISSKSTKKLIEMIRKKIPGVAIRTSLIVGYPLETDKEFNELLKFVKETEFERLGVFTYSMEEDTYAERYGDPVPKDVKEERKNQLMEIQQEISLKKNSKFVGKELKVLVDSKMKKIAYARSEFDAPEIDNEIIIETDNQVKTGNFYNVKIVDYLEYDLVAKLT